MTVKVQLSVVSTEEVRQVLIYNESHTIQWEGDASEEIITAMSGMLKQFFKATLIDDPNKKGAKRIRLDYPIKDQDW